MYVTARDGQGAHKLRPVALSSVRMQKPHPAAPWWVCVDAACLLVQSKLWVSVCITSRHSDGGLQTFGDRVAAECVCVCVCVWVGGEAAH